MTDSRIFTPLTPDSPPENPPHFAVVIVRFKDHPAQYLTVPCADASARVTGMTVCGYGRDE